MKVTVLLFARYRMDAGVDRLELDLPVGATVRSAASAVASRTGVALEGSMCAVNERYARPEASLDAGDRIAFLPPVSGG